MLTSFNMYINFGINTQFYIRTYVLLHSNLLIPIYMRVVFPPELQDLSQSLNWAASQSNARTLTTL